jgi:hypothetical protein
MLEALVWLGRIQEAHSHALLRSEARARVYGLLAIYKIIVQNESRFTQELVPTLIQQMLENANHISYTTDKIWALMAIVEHMATAHYPQTNPIFEQAQAIAISIKADLNKVQALLEIVRQLAAVGRSEQAQVVVPSIENASPRARALAAVGQFEQAQSRAHTIEDANSKDRALGEIARALAAVGQFEQVQSLALTIKDDWSLAYIVEQLAANGQFEQAQSLALTIEDAFLKGLAMAQIFEQLATVGQFEQVQSLALTIEDDQALANIAKHLAVVRHPAASRILEQTQSSVPS